MKDRVIGERAIRCIERWFCVPLETASRIDFNTTTVVAVAYLATIVGAEVVAIRVGIVPGTVFTAILIPILLSHYVLAGPARYRPLLPVLALAPLLRILSVTMPVRDVPQIYWYALVGAPLLVAALLTARLLGLSWAKLGFRTASWPPQVLIALSGLPLSILAFLILRPDPLSAELGLREAIVGSVILIIFTAFLEEFIFRGLLQGVAVGMFGRAGILYSSALFAATYIGSLSLSYVLYMASIGLFFGWGVHRTRSIWGAVIAHSILSVGMVSGWPLVWR